MSSPTPDVATRTLVHVLGYFAACGELVTLTDPEDISEEVHARLELAPRDELIGWQLPDMAAQLMRSYVAEVEVYRLVGDDAYGDESGAMIVDLLVEYGGPTTVLRAEVDANGHVTTAEVRTSRHEQPGRSSNPMARARTTTSRQDDAVQDALALLGVLS